MDISLLVDLYELTMAQSYSVYRSATLASFDLFVRDLGRNRSYLLAAGLGDILNYIKQLKFGREELRYLKSLRLFCDDFLEYLAGFKFRGDIWALEEGEVFFPNEPVLRVTAPVIQAQIIESFLLNTINLQTMIASKASRVVNSAKGRPCFDFALRRTHGLDAAVKVARSSYIAGFAGTSNLLAGKAYGIPVIGTMAHSFVMSFKQEIDSFLAYAETFPGQTTLLVDTYDTKKGIDNAIAIGLYLKEKGSKLKGIRLDSGDIVSLSKFARKRLDRAGLKYVQIFASGNLDEYKIEMLIKRKARADSFGVGTNMGTSADAPSLDVVYKISEVTDENGRFLPTMKLSKGKVTYPGRKQIFRIADKRERFLKDILGLENEDLEGRPLLKKVVNQGKIAYNFPSLEKIRSLAKRNIERLPDYLKDIDSRASYPVIISPKLRVLQRKLSYRLEKRQ